ncbi:MAG: type II toxin-antitoxin system HigB family toxin [Alphaproteobacteria bacterium]|jgi:mRNA interferase HigB|uniref:Membrane protein n=1 Tax=Pseudorhizobium pelagicum TaxID=1509405 RepID=A0A922TAH2_9HYPH|nr:type II toxin-antitoxin system HigB family toxin [Pseudorhizobium pelagicum]MBU1316422.1 type II toxin-antitoxin system HigB family toxin [Alphaproteobacteria bacterium]MDY6962223.1 type II toxin-antitoxin system HigB family toxin [Pseudomonadota bacterium]KEQ05857.1 membrane protein [Pseudorhizobium pelagicum]KEQ08760.1 membrane protein [Pseudorhizobium pelagicum]MBU1548753.1 type II toxin-antitoxin system HigB family toxin [Alphaproteobacteria bacterium]|tara:strand:+ start:191 stop:511 length:321 start_codon:yes stop_codon:yes gene_type:complete
MRIIARRTLVKFAEGLRGRRDQPAVKEALEVWFHHASRAQWKSAAEIKRTFATASIINAERVVFNIKGNDYRLIVAIDFEKSIIWIKWIGNHKDYDQIDAAQVEYD